MRRWISVSNVVFCEPSCVSAGLTLSPRQRITVLREISRLNVSGEEPHIAASLINQFNYSGDATCATDGLCAIACPVNIDTGKIIKELRHDKISSRQYKNSDVDCRPHEFCNFFGPECPFDCWFCPYNFGNRPDERYLWRNKKNYRVIISHTGHRPCRMDRRG